MSRRGVVLAALLGAYVAVGLRPAIGAAFRRGALDPFDPAARALELRLGDGRFADALPLATDLDRLHPREPQVALWIARIHHGLRDPRREAQAWDAYVDLGVAPAEACPAWPEAYAAAGDRDKALGAYERCAAFSPADSEAWTDLAEAYARDGRSRDACNAFERALQLDPDNPIPARRLHELQDGSQ